MNKKFTFEKMLRMPIEAKSFFKPTFVHAMTFSSPSTSKLLLFKIANIMIFVFHWKMHGSNFNTAWIIHLWTRQENNNILSLIELLASHWYSGGCLIEVFWVPLFHKIKIPASLIIEPENLSYWSLAYGLDGWIISSAKDFFRLTS